MSICISDIGRNWENSLKTYIQMDMPEGKEKYNLSNESTGLLILGRMMNN